jgi:hypothetical protein
VVTTVTLPAVTAPAHTVVETVTAVTTVAAPPRLS